MANAFWPYGNSSQGLLVGALVILFVAWISQIVRIWRGKRKRLIDIAAKLPGPKASPFIGNALQFNCKPEQLFNRLVQMIIPYQDVTPMRFWLGSLLQVVITEPCDIEVILNSQKSTLKGSLYRLMLPFYGDGLVCGSDQTWRSHRKLIAPMLNGRTLESFAEIVERHSKILVQKLRSLADGVDFDVGPYLTRCTIDAMCETVMGCVDIKSQGDPNHEFKHASERMYEIVHDRVMKVWLHPDWIYRLSPSYQEQKQCQQIIHRFIEKLITAKQKEAPLNVETDRYNGDWNSILEQLIRQMQTSKHIWNLQELRDEIFTVYTAAQDTITVTGNFTLLMLGIHKDIQENVRSELDQVLCNDTENIPTSSLPELKYLEMVIKETLRLFPIIPFLVRELRSDLALDSCLLPEGCEVILALYMTHRNPRHWKTPEKFIPERFTAEEIALRHPYAHVPFSGGLMGCIGRKFAMNSLKLIVANVVRNYRIDSTVSMEDVRLKSDIGIRSVNGFKISLESL